MGKTLKYVTEFEFPSSAGFTGSATDRRTTPVKSYERSKPAYAKGGAVRRAEGGPVPDKDVNANKDNTRIAQAPPPPPPKPRQGDTIQIDPKGSTVDTLKNQRERQMKELGLKRGGKVPKKMKSSPKKMRYGTSLPPEAQSDAPGDFSGSPGDASSAGGGGAGLRKGGKPKRRYADGGRVVRFANDGIKTSSLDPGSATDKRSDPSNNMNQQTGGKSPLRPGFAKGGKNFIKGAIKHPGAFTAKAKAKGETPAQLQKQVLKPGSTASTQTKRQANLRKTLVGMNKAQGGPVKKGLGGFLKRAVKKSVNPVAAIAGKKAGRALDPVGSAVQRRIAPSRPAAPGGGALVGSQMGRAGLSAQLAGNGRPNMNLQPTMGGPLSRAATGGPVTAKRGGRTPY